MGGQSRLGSIFAVPASSIYLLFLRWLKEKWWPILLRLSGRWILFWERLIDSRVLMSTQPIDIQPRSQPVDIADEIASFSAEVEAEVERHLSKYPVKRSAILPLMFIVQRERGYLDPGGVAYLARRLRLRITDIWEVAT